MNLAEMQVRLRRRIGSPLEADVSNDVLTDHLNSAMLDIMDRFRFHKARKRCRFNTQPGLSRYGIPTDAKVIFRLMNVTKGYKVVKHGDRHLASDSPSTDSTSLDDSVNFPPEDTWGQPTEYIRYRDYMELMPIPDDVYTMEIFYKYDEAELVDADDEPGIPRVWHIGIVMLAVWFYYSEQKDVPKTQDALNLFTQWAEGKPNEIDEESVDIDTGIIVPTLDAHLKPRLDFNHAD
jgi:hypothetical protein